MNSGMSPKVQCGAGAQATRLGCRVPRCGDRQKLTRTPTAKLRPASGARPLTVPIVAAL